MSIKIEDITFRPLSLDTGKRSKVEINLEIDAVEKLTNKHLSEPYSIYVYRFFLNNWPELCILAFYKDELIGCIISKVEPHKDTRVRGYIGMLSVDDDYRGLGIAKRLISDSIAKMKSMHCDEIILETEVVNKKALRLYENFGFQRVKRLFRYYMNRHDAFRLVLPITDKANLRSVFLNSLPDELNIPTKY
ncbi:peptide alpha-N-acetyltransferase [Martiniozyma asiatica (nom. inval.)]|nr:peptide alpha-N-acetyltransferase [Martiniozyma asiatica]